MLRFDRIQHLISPDELLDKLIVQVGVGSGGAPVNDHLTMNGVRRWALFDPDTYDEVNLVKHPRLRSQLGRQKVEIQADWIVDRNPDAEVRSYPDDVVTSARFADAVREADLILCCADKSEVRLYVNAVAVGASTPCVTASVFRQGFGGEVYAYVPGTHGCLNCMIRTADEQGWNIDDSIDPTDSEQEAIYGLNLRDYKASGLSLDIQTVAIMQARFALDMLGTVRRFSPMPANWVILHNRPIPNVEDTGFHKIVQLRVQPRKDCQCAVT